MGTLFFTPRGPPSPSSQAGAGRRGSGGSRCHRNGGFAGAWFCPKLRAWRLEVPWRKQEGLVSSQGPSNIHAVLGAFLPPSPSRSPHLIPRSGREVPVYTHQALVGKDHTFPRGEAATCCPATHRRWSQRERTTVRSTEARHGSPSHHDSLGCFQKMQEGQSQAVHKAGLDPHHRCSDR